MEKAEILKRVDHTLLAQEAGWAEIRAVSYTHLIRYLSAL